MGYNSSIIIIVRVRSADAAYTSIMPTRIIFLLYILIPLCAALTIARARRIDNILIRVRVSARRGAR